MADNTTLNSMSGGDVIATEDISGVKIQRVKIVVGDKDSDGTDASNNTPLPITGTVTATPTGTYLTNLGQVSGTTADVNIGNATNGTLRVVLASNQPTVPVSIAASVTVAGTIIANAGANLNTSTLALESGGNLATLAGGVTSSKYQVNIAQISGTAPPNANIAGTLVVGGGASNASNINTTTNPLLIGGSDYGAIAKIQTAKVDSTGGQYVTILGTPAVVQSNASNFLATVSGTVGITANSAFNLSQVSGTTTDTNSGTKSAGTLRVVIATDQPQLTNKLLVTPDANTAYNLSQVLGSTVVATVTGIQDTMPRKKDGTVGLAPQYFASRISSKTTTYVTNSTAYLSVLKVTTSNAGTGATMNINDQSGSGNRTFAAPNIPGGNMTTGTFLESYAEPMKLTSGIQIITGGTTFGDCNVFMTYWQ